MTPTVSSPTSSTLIDAANDRPGDDPIFRLNAEAKARAKAGESIINATLGALMEDDGSLAIMPSVATAFGQITMAESAGYAPISGAAPFLEAVIDDLYGDTQLREYSTAVSTPGGTGALHHAIVNFLEPGQAMFVPSYFWGPYATLATHTRRALETFEMFNEKGNFNVEAFASGLDALLARQGRALIVLNFPCNNPTGYSLHESEWEQVTAIIEDRAAKYPVIPLIDYAYGKFGVRESEIWVRYAERMAKVTTVLTAWTVSKSFAQYGARVGALVASNQNAAERQKLANALSFSCRGTWSNCNHAGQLAITRLLTDSELRAHVKLERQHLCGLLASRVDAFNTEAAALDIKYPRYEGGFFVAVFAEDPKATAKHMREENGVYVVPIQGAVRVALCSTAVADIPRLAKALKEGLEATSN